MATVSGSQRQLIHTSNTYESNGDVTVGGNLQVNGTTMTVDTANLLVEDHNIVIGNVATPTDTTADGGGITLKGATDKTINWVNSTDAWTFSDKISVPSLYLTSNPSLSSESTALFINASNQVGYRELGSNAFTSTTIPTNNNQLTNGAGYITGNQTITLTGDASGSGTTSISVTIADDSHNHVISNIDGLQTALNGKAPLASPDFTGTVDINAASVGINVLADDVETILKSRNDSATGDPDQFYIEHNYGSVNIGNSRGNINFNAGTLQYGGNTVATQSWVSSQSYLTGNQTITLSGDVSGSGTTSISVALANDSVGAAEIAANAVGASELNVSGNGTTAQFLRSDGDGTFSWATPTDTNTTYSAGTHLSLSGTTFNVDFATADKVVNIGHNSTSNEAELILDTSNSGSPQISFTEHGDASWAIGVDDGDNSFKIHGSASSTIPTINGLGTPLFEITTSGLGYLGTNRIFADNYHPNADTLTTARNIALTGAVTGNANFDGSGNISIATTATADPTLTLSGDASGSATFTNLGNATLTVTVADDSHNHIISNVDGLQTALDAKQAAGTYNTIIGTGTDIDTSAFNIVDNIYVTDGVITSMGTRELANLRIPDTRAGELTPNDYTEKAISLDFTDEFGSLGAWWSGITMKGWSDGYTAWQLIGPSNTSANDNLYFRSGVGTTWGTMQRIFHDGYHPNADKLTTARSISLTGAVTGSTSFDGSGNVSIATTATADPTLTLSGDASGSATFTNLGNATLTVTVADDSHNHIISNVDGLQTALDGKASSSHSHSNATTSTAGFMSNTDKSKLDGIASGANNYSLPEATATSRGGIELFSNTDQSVSANSVSTTAGRTYGIQLNSAGQAVVNVPWSDTNTTYSVGDGGLTQKNFTTTLYNKLNAIEAGATGDQTAAEIRTLVESATDSNVFTDADHTKLNGIATNANNYSLPAATSTVRGGIELYTNTLGGSAQSVTSTSNRYYGIQVNSAGQAMVNVPWTNVNSSYLTQDDYEDIHWKQTGRIFTPQCTPLFYNSSGTAGTLAAVCFSRTEVTSTANAWAQANLYRGITNEVSWSGGGIEFGRKLGVSFRCAFLASGTQAQSIRYMVGGRANNVQAAGSNPIVSRGFGVEIRSRTGTTLEWRVFAHNGTSFSASSWSDIPSNATSIYTKELYIYSDGSGNIEAGIDDRGGDGSSWTTKTTTGGPTSNGNSTYPYITHEVRNASSGSSYARARVYDYKIFSE